MSMTCKATIRLICEYLEGRLALRWRVKFSATWGNAGIAALFSTPQSSHAGSLFRSRSGTSINGSRPRRLVRKLIKSPPSSCNNHRFVFLGLSYLCAISYGYFLALTG